MRLFGVCVRNRKEASWISRMSRPLHNDQRGISLLEFIIVIAIIMVVTAGAFLGFRVLNSGDASKASKLISSELTTLRENTLSMKGPWTMEIVNNNGAYYIMIYQDGTLFSKDKLGSRIELSYHENGVAYQYSIDKQDKIILEMKQGSGEVEKIQKISGLSEDELMAPYEDTEDPDGATTLNSLMVDVASQYFVFEVKGNNKNNQTEVNLAYATGRIVVGDMTTADSETGGTAVDEEESE